MLSYYRESPRDESKKRDEQQNFHDRGHHAGQGTHGGKRWLTFRNDHGQGWRDHCQRLKPGHISQRPRGPCRNSLYQGGPVRIQTVGGTGRQGMVRTYLSELQQLTNILLCDCVYCHLLRYDGREDSGGRMKQLNKASYCSRSSIRLIPSMSMPIKPPMTSNSISSRFKPWTNLKRPSEMASAS